MGLGSLGPEGRSGLPHICSPPPALPSQGSIKEDKPKAQDTALPADAFHVSFQKCHSSQQASSFLFLFLWCSTTRHWNGATAPKEHESWGRAPSSVTRALFLLFLSFSLHSRMGLSEPVSLGHLAGNPCLDRSGTQALYGHPVYQPTSRKRTEQELAYADTWKMLMGK